jgi:hypothetical protein
VDTQESAEAVGDDVADDIALKRQPISVGLSG